MQIAWYIVVNTPDKPNDQVDDIRLFNGVHKIYARAFDQGGNFLDSVPVEVTITSGSNKINSQMTIYSTMTTLSNSTVSANGSMFSLLHGAIGLGIGLGVIAIPSSLVIQKYRKK